MFIPFDLQMKFDNLTKISIHLTEANFENRVFNSNMNWFVKLIQPKHFEKDDSVFTKAYFSLRF